MPLVRDVVEQQKVDTVKKYVDNTDSSDELSDELSFT